MDFVVYVHSINGYVKRAGTVHAPSLDAALRHIANEFQNQNPRGYIPGETVDKTEGVAILEFRMHEVLIFSNAALATERTAIERTLKNLK